MSDIKYSRAKQLADMGREIIDLPEKIWFGGREQLQRLAGPHHLPQYQETGTYWHLNCCRQRLRIAEDRLKRAQQFKSSAYEGRAYGSTEDMEREVKDRQRELAIVFAGGNPEKDTLADLLKAEVPEKKVTEVPKVEKAPAKVAKGKKVVKEETTDLDTEPPMSAAQLSKTLATAKKAKPLDRDDE